MQRKCLKCGHVHAEATGDALEPCPTCGAIYSRVEAHAARAAVRPARVVPPEPPADAMRAIQENIDGANTRPMGEPAATAMRHQPTSQESAADFVQVLRQQSLYPSFRGMVKLIYFVWMTLPVLSLIGAITIVSFGKFGTTSIFILLGSLLFVIVMLIFGRAAREASIMLADLSDAAVHLAKNAKR